jgi:benzoate membrane transport protein
MSEQQRREVRHDESGASATVWSSVEGDTCYRQSLRNLGEAITLSTISTGLVTFIMVLTVPFPVLYQAASEAGWNSAQTGSWVFAVLATGGVMQLLLALGYRQPLAAGVSTVATAFLVRALPSVSPQEAVAAYLLCGAFFVVLAFTGAFGRYLNAIPQEIVMGMLAGALLRFETDVFQEVVRTPLLVGPPVAAWLLSSRLRSRFVPPVTAALAVGISVALLRGLGPASQVHWGVTLPDLYRPDFTLNAFLSLTLPLLLLVASQNAAAVGALWSNGYRPPANAITLATGFFSMVGGVMGAQGVSLGAQRSAMAADQSVHPDPGMRYSAVVVDAVCVLASAGLATTIVGVFNLLPISVIRVVAGLAMLPVVVHASVHALAGTRFRFGGFLALVIAASNISLFGVSSVFWALLLAPPLSLILDQKDATP